MIIINKKVIMFLLLSFAVIGVFFTKSILVDYDYAPSASQEKSGFVNDDPISNYNGREKEGDLQIEVLTADIKASDEAFYSDYSIDEKRFHLQTLSEVIALSSEQNWEQFLSKVDTMQIDNDSELLSLLLVQAAVSDAGVDVMLELINRGAEITSKVYRVLVERDKLYAIKQLARFGLDLFMIDDSGRNGISYSVNTVRSHSVFNYLLSKGVSVNPDSELPDPLLVAMRKCNSDKVAIIYAITLIEAGANIDEEHYVMYENLKQNKSICASQIGGYF